MEPREQSLKYWEKMIGEKLMLPRIELEKCPIEITRETRRSRTLVVSVVESPPNEFPHPCIRRYKKTPPPNLVKFYGSNKNNWPLNKRNMMLNCFGPPIEESRNWSAPRATYGRQVNNPSVASANKVTSACDGSKSADIVIGQTYCLSSDEFCSRTGINLSVRSPDDLQDLEVDIDNLNDSVDAKRVGQYAVANRRAYTKRPRPAIIEPCIKRSRNWNAPRTTYGKKKVEVKDEPSAGVELLDPEEYLLPLEVQQHGTISDSDFSQEHFLRPSSEDMAAARSHIWNSFLDEIQANDCFQLNTAPSDCGNAKEESNINLPPDLPEDAYLNFEKDGLLPDLKAQKIQRLKTGTVDPVREDDALPVQANDISTFSTNDFFTGPVLPVLCLRTVGVEQMSSRKIVNIPVWHSCGDA